jgi:hypothetical protein
VLARGCGISSPIGGSNSAECPARAHRFALSPLSARPATVHALSGATCVEVSAPATYDYFTGVELAPGLFAAATLESD